MLLGKNPINPLVKSKFVRLVDDLSGAVFLLFSGKYRDPLIEKNIQENVSPQMKIF